MITKDKILEQFSKLNVNKSGERRAPHKPLLLLVAISHLLQGQKKLSFEEVEESLRPLLNSYAPPVKSRHQPELPYWHLQNDNLWVVSESANLDRQSGGFPRIAELRRTTGQLPDKVASTLLADQGLLARVVRFLLEEHFEESLHEDILASVGLPVYDASTVAEDIAPYGKQRRRDPNFRDKVLRAYEHRCAITGFRAALRGSYFGCEAAHVKWFAYDGPDSLENGIAMEPTLHKLFDAGAWSLTDDRRVLVSAEFTGSDEAVSRLRDLHGKPIRKPLPGSPQVSLEYIHWHRESNQGGVFRQPALAL